MKRSLVLVFLCLTLLSGFANAQSIFGGIRIEPNFLLSNNQVHGPLGLNLEPALNLGIKLSHGFALEGRYGILFSEYFGGKQYGLYARKNIHDENIYALGGIVLHSSSGNPYSTRVNQEDYSDYYALLGGGIGYNVSDHFSIELHYLKTLNEKFGYSDEPDINGIHYNYNKLYSIVKLSFSYNFSFSGEEKTAASVKSSLGNKETEVSALEVLKERRRLFWCGGIGYPDLLSTQLGYQIADFFSVAGVLNWNAFSNPGFKKFTTGLKLTGYFNGPGFNNVSLEFNRRVENFFSADSKGGTVLTLGGDDISVRRFHFFWAAGLMSERYDGGLAGTGLFFKVGTTLNFF